MFLYQNIRSVGQLALELPTQTWGFHQNVNLFKWLLLWIWVQMLTLKTCSVFPSVLTSLWPCKCGQQRILWQRAQRKRHWQSSGIERNTQLSCSCQVLECVAMRLPPVHTGLGLVSSGNLLAESLHRWTKNCHVPKQLRETFSCAKQWFVQYLWKLPISDRKCVG